MLLEQKTSRRLFCDIDGCLGRAGDQVAGYRLQVTGEGGRRVVARIGFAQGSCKRKGSPRRALLWRDFSNCFQVSGCGRVEARRIGGWDGTEVIGGSQRSAVAVSGETDAKHPVRYFCRTCHAPTILANSEF